MSDQMRDFLTEFVNRKADEGATYCKNFVIDLSTIDKRLQIGGQAFNFKACDEAGEVERVGADVTG